MDNLQNIIYKLLFSPSNEIKLKKKLLWLSKYELYSVDAQLKEIIEEEIELLTQIIIQH